MLAEIGRDQSSAEQQFRYLMYIQGIHREPAKSKGILLLASEEVANCKRRTVSRIDLKDSGKIRKSLLISDMIVMAVPRVNRFA